MTTPETAAADETTELLFYRDGNLRSCRAEIVAVDGRNIALDRTVFFPGGGGQPNDSGALILGERESETAPQIKILKTGRDGGRIWHYLSSEQPPETEQEIKPGMKVVARLDWRRRHKLMRCHTALHLLSVCLPGAQITGASVSPSRGRIDFDLPQPPERLALQARLNELIRRDAAVRAHWMPASTLDEYPEWTRNQSARPPRGVEKVRMIEIAGVDRQFCGGTHVAATGEIGRVDVAKIESKGRANRRVTIELS